AGQPIDLEVTAEVSTGLDLISEENRKILTYGLTIIGGLLVVYLFVNARSENKRIISVLDSESDNNDD
ncbi:MAG TPA: hypothetical protein QGF70_03890, partial [Candidatus Thalassarchaeaceae archaeon]|nr:hypothetical protein [Candidatus Thalassarchaeaceae archaeon]